MNMVGHEHISVNVRLVLDRRSSQDREKTFVIGLRSKDVYSVDTSLNHMVRRARGLEAVSARHIGRECTNRCRDEPAFLRRFWRKFGANVLRAEKLNEHRIGKFCQAAGMGSD